MGDRLDLHMLLLVVMGGGKVYFQPPPSADMVYPCIVYERRRSDTKHADNQPYKLSRMYQITLIDTTPDSEYILPLSMTPGITHTNSFTKDKLSHDVFSLFY